MKIVIVGTGYVGLVSGLCYAKLGHQVACVDIDQSKIAKLDLGQAPFYEPGLQELLSELQEEGKIMFTTRMEDVVHDADIFMICVGTPSTPTGEANLDYVMSAAKMIGSCIKHEAVVVVKSTVPVGTTRRVGKVMSKAMRNQEREDLVGVVRMAMMPEFLREGSAIEDFMNPDRIVIGADDEVVKILLDRLHDGLDTPRLMMGIESAELTKYAANAFLATKISFINEIATIAERTGADVRDIAIAIGMDNRIGPHFLNAGIGYGGSCFPKDVSALAQIAGKKGYSFKLLSSVIEVNNKQRDRFMKKVESVLGHMKGRTIGVWGLSFKPGTDDIRESASIDLVGRLVAKGVNVKVYDPKAMEPASRVLPDSIEYAPTAIDAASGAEALLILTEWPDFGAVSFSTLRSVMLEPRIFDGRNLLVGKDLSGFEYYGVGFTSNE